MFQFTRRNQSDASDLELIERYRKKRDVKTAGILFDRYVHLVYGLCLRYLVDREESKDAVMQIFEKILVELREKEVHNFKSWLYVVSRNHCLMELRKKPKTVDISTFGENNEDFIMESPYEMHLIDRDPENERLRDCLKKLSEEQKRCIQLFYYKKKSYREIVAITSFELKKVKSYIQNAKRNLKNCLEQ